MLIHSSLQKQAKIVFTLVVTVQSTAQRNVFGQLLLLSLEQHAQPSRALWGCMHEERISSLIPFNFYPAFKIGMYEGRLRLSGRPKRVKCYSLIFLRSSSINARQKWLLSLVLVWLMRMLRRNWIFRDKTHPIDTDIQWWINVQEIQIQKRWNCDHNWLH